MLMAATQDVEPQLTLRTGSRADTGGWCRGSRVWLCVTHDEIILFAAARRQHCERLPLTAAQGSWYCHSTGQLVLVCEEELRFDRLTLKPLDALRVLKCIEQVRRPAPIPHATATENSRA